MPFSHTWFPDTGETNHATPDVTSLVTSEPYQGSDTFRVGNGTCLQISGISHTSVPFVSRSLRMSYVLHVPGLSSSLLSIQRFATEDSVFFEFHPSFFLLLRTLPPRGFFLRVPVQGYFTHCLWCALLR